MNMPRTLRDRRAFTLIELLAVIAIIGLLSAMIFPVIGNAREKAHQTYCINNLRQLGQAVNAYASDFGNHLPLAEPLPSAPVDPGNPKPRIRDLLSRYVGGSADVFRCPRDQTRFNIEGASYEWTFMFNGQHLDKLKFMGFIDIPQSKAPIMWDYDNVHQNQSGGAKNVLYADGHVETP
jgi:prepilin-type N-terminal cleavage/methylation domain-containing protein/prepilin-type processing-associated H-X9-DG protein